MITKEIVEYVRTEIQKGTPRETISANLISSGSWKQADVEEAFLVLGKEKTGTSSPVQPLPPKTFFGRVVAPFFRTKWSSVATIILTGVLLQFFSSIFLSFLKTPLVGGVVSLTPLILWVLMIFILKAKGYQKESENLLRGIGTLILIFIIMGIIGFGLCVFLLSGFNN